MRFTHRHARVTPCHATKVDSHRTPDPIPWKGVFPFPIEMSKILVPSRNVPRTAPTPSPSLCAGGSAEFPQCSPAPQHRRTPPRPHMRPLSDLSGARPSRYEICRWISARGEFTLQAKWKTSPLPRLGLARCRGRLAPLPALITVSHKPQSHPILPI